MTRAQAAEIAALLNARNELTVEYDAERALNSASDFDFEERADHVIACVERRRVQWYQWEICHLSVREDWEGKGIAHILYQRVAVYASDRGARVLQCTIREGNVSSERFFARQGFSKAVSFVNQESGNTVGVWVKSLSTPAA
jgi:N-acetylglutamate synthase-like GNAT family acetyltransferase